VYESAAGTQSSMKIRMKGYGVPHLRGDGRGGQYVLILVDLPEKVSSRQADLIRQISEGGL
jgi:DnaJ-class molecular chaperone